MDEDMALPPSEDRAFAATPSSPQAVSPVPASIPSAVLQPFVDALHEFEAECFFGCLGTSEAGTYYPDTLRFALVHADGGKARFNGGRTMDEADEADDDGFGDIGSFTLGDLRKLKAVADAQGIEARSDETPQAAQPEGREPGPKDVPKRRWWNWRADAP